MKVEYRELFELLSAFGITLKINGKKATFIDAETNQPMEVYRVIKNERKEYTDKVDVLFNGWPFFVVGPTKSFKINIGIRDDRIRVSKITKQEKLESHLYETSEFESDKFNQFCFHERTYRYPVDEMGRESYFFDTLSCVTFNVSEIVPAETGELRITKPNKDFAYAWYVEDKETGEIIKIDDYYEEINQQEFVDLIEHSRVFKNIMNISCPKLTKQYEIIKNNCAGKSM